MSEQYGGFLFVFDEAKRTLALEERASIGSFTDVVSGPDWRPKEVELCLLSFYHRRINYAALGRRGSKVAYKRYRFTFDHLVPLDDLPFDEIEFRLEPRLISHFVRSSSGAGSRVPPTTWQKLWAVIEQLRPDSVQDLRNLEGLRRSSKNILQRDGYEIMAQEKDAVGVALDIFGRGSRDIDRHNLLSQVDPSVRYTPAPFLTSLKRTRLVEDVMISHDSFVFGDWSVLRKQEVATILVRRPGEVLTIINANRTDIEHTLGVDLVYFNHRFHSTVMVQYKRMVKERGEKFVYRPRGDSNYAKQIGLMKKFENENPEPEGEYGLEGFRLHSKTFYWKLCESVSYKPTATDLIQGGYIPLEYWEMLVESDEVKGPQGGVGFTQVNVTRCINNTMFTDLVQGGWIGSRAKTTDVLNQIIGECLDNDRSVMLAASHAA
jgi:hypothetical protein